MKISKELPALPALYAIGNEKIRYFWEDMALAININQSKIERTTEVSDGFQKVVSNLGTLILVLLFPFVVFILLLCQFFLNRMNRVLERNLRKLKEKEGSFDADFFEEARKLHAFLEKQIVKTSETVADMDEDTPWVMKGFAREFKSYYSKLQEMHAILHRPLFVEGSLDHFSPDQIESLSDFFGPDEDYQEDTYLSLNGNA